MPTSYANKYETPLILQLAPDPLQPQTSYLDHSMHSPQQLALLILWKWRDFIKHYNSIAITVCLNVFCDEKSHDYYDVFFFNFGKSEQEVIPCITISHISPDRGLTDLSLLLLCPSLEFVLFLPFSVATSSSGELSDDLLAAVCINYCINECIGFKQTFEASLLRTFKMTFSN